MLKCLLSPAFPFLLCPEVVFFVSISTINHVSTTKLHSNAHTNEHPFTNTHTLPSSAAIVAWCLTSCWETEAHARTERFSGSCSQAEGCDIALKGPEEVDNSAASTMLEPEGSNSRLRILPAAERLRDGSLTAEEAG